MATPGPVATYLEGWCKPEAVQRACDRLRSHLHDRPVAEALDLISRELEPDDEGFAVGFWARGVARCAGASVPFDAHGMDRFGSKS